MQPGPQPKSRLVAPRAVGSHRLKQPLSPGRAWARLTPRFGNPHNILCLHSGTLCHNNSLTLYVPLSCVPTRALFWPICVAAQTRLAEPGRRGQPLVHGLCSLIAAEFGFFFPCACARRSCSPPVDPFFRSLNSRALCSATLFSSRRHGFRR